ncbi:unnamed protein product [Acanthoscelides obtectus]|uniref:Uncharacterized protein n=1 Tax=Acanthoscelides obtectus TaxID=200917 RepID=A0A9P0MAG8_ACAOB|nr:unnamed protein product [Acanthoscelides obtectus]CAK1658597.1 hypothetical protein AOBTE_LOCUS21012 [Acanthoscelides obtectus]
MNDRSQNDAGKISGRFTFEKPVQYIAENSADESGYYHVESRRTEITKPKIFNRSKDTLSQVEHFTCKHASTIGEPEYNPENTGKSSTQPVGAPSLSEDADLEDACNAINQILRNPLVDRLLMNTIYKPPDPANLSDKWNTFVFIVRKLEPNTPQGILEHPNAKDCVKMYVRKRRRKRHSTATLLKRKQKMIKRLQRRDTIDKMQEDDLFKDIAKFLVSNKLKHKGYTYVPVMFSHQVNDGLAGYTVRDLNGDLNVKLTEASTMPFSASKSATAISSTTTATTASSATSASTPLWTVPPPSSTDYNEFALNLPNPVTHLNLNEDKMATESVAIHAGGSMVPGILIYPIGKKLKRFHNDKTDLDFAADNAVTELEVGLDQSTKASIEFVPTYTLPVLKRGVPPECAEDTEKLLQLLATANDKDSPPRRAIPGVLVYPLAKIKRFVSGSTTVSDSSDAQPTFYALDRNILRERAPKILKKEVPPECLKDTDQLLNMLANAIDENLTSTSTDEESTESSEKTTEPENTTGEQEGSTSNDVGTSSEMFDLKDLNINLESGGGLSGGEIAPLGGLGGDTLGGAGIGLPIGETSGEFGQPSEATRSYAEITENNFELYESVKGSENLLISTRNSFNLGTIGVGEPQIQAANMEGGLASFSLSSNDQSTSSSDVPVASSAELSTEAKPSQITNSARSSATTQETECVTVMASTTAESGTSSSYLAATTALGSNKDDHVGKNMTNARLKRLEKDLKLVNEVEKILKGTTGPRHKIRKRELGSIDIDDTSVEETEAPLLEITITINTEKPQCPEAVLDKPTKTVREINHQMLRGLGKLLKWKNSHNSKSPSRPKRSRIRMKRKRRKKKHRHKPPHENRKKDHL